MCSDELVKINKWRRVTPALVELRQSLLIKMDGCWASVGPAAAGNDSRKNGDPHLPSYIMANPLNNMRHGSHLAKACSVGLLQASQLLLTQDLGSRMPYVKQTFSFCFDLACFFYQY